MMLVSSCILKSGAILSTVGLATMEISADPIAMGQRVGGLTTSEVLGVVAVSCVIGMVVMYWQQQRTHGQMRKDNEDHTKQLFDMIKQSTTAAKEQSDVSRELVKAVGDMRLEISHCQNKRG